MNRKEKEWKSYTESARNWLDAIEWRAPELKPFSSAKIVDEKIAKVREEMEKEQQNQALIIDLLKELDALCEPLRIQESFSNDSNESHDERKQLNLNAKVLCKKVALILNGKSKFENGVCSVHINRQLQVEVQGKKTSSIASIDVVFESLDKEGNALNIAEIAILQDEAPDFIREIAKSGLIISAFHNHWLFTNPLIMYLHVQSIEPPVQFAEKISKALSVLK